MKKIVIIIGLFLIVAAFAGALLVRGFGQRAIQTAAESQAQAAKADDQYREQKISINQGDTFGALMESYGVTAQTVQDILAASNDVYDLASIRAGKELFLYYDAQTDALVRLLYRPNSESEVIVSLQDAAWQAEKKAIAYEVKERKVSGTIHSSLYETAMAMSLDDRVIIKMADILAWQVDFAVDVREGDTFSLLYEERYLNGAYVMPGKILAAKYVNDGTDYLAYYYQESEDAEGYFDQNGHSTEKIFLKSPLQYKYISSGYTNARYHPVTKTVSPHRAIDYAATYGTPAVTVGDGTVVAAGWNGGYGYAVDVRHNETYTTRYGHFSKLAVKRGQKVSQGQIIGYVGSTGWSTGPHLHFEMMKNGAKVNPFTIDVPTAKGIAPENLSAFKEYISQYQF